MHLAFLPPSSPPVSGCCRSRPATIQPHALRSPARPPRPQIAFQARYVIGVLVSRTRCRCVAVCASWPGLVNYILTPRACLAVYPDHASGPRAIRQRSNLAGEMAKSFAFLNVPFTVQFHRFGGGCVPRKKTLDGDPRTLRFLEQPGRYFGGGE